jgi:hypothetical protein
MIYSSRFGYSTNKLFKRGEDKVSKKISLLSVLVLFGIGLFGCASQETTHNTPHVFAGAKDVFRQQFKGEIKKSFLTDVSQNSQKTRTDLSGENISTKSRY